MTGAWTGSGGSWFGVPAYFPDGMADTAGETCISLRVLEVAAWHRHLPFHLRTCLGGVVGRLIDAPQKIDLD